MVATPTLRERIAEIIEPLQAEAVKLDREIQELEQRLAQLRDDRRQLDSVLKRATGEPLRKPGPQPTAPAHRNAAKGDKWFTAVHDYIVNRDKGKEPREIIVGHIHQEIKEDADKRGLALNARPGRDSVARVVERMHEAGELRVLRRTNGGALVYARTTKGG